MTVKFKEKVCECGLDLTTATPAHVIPTETTEAGDLLEPVGECPACHRSYILDYGPEDKAYGLRTFVFEGPDGKDMIKVGASGKAKVYRREPEPEPVAEPVPEPEPEPAPEPAPEPEPPPEE